MLYKHGRIDLVGRYGSVTSDARFKSAVSDKKVTLRVKLADLPTP